MTTPDHGLLLGLGDNDHPQYLSDEAHTKAVHDALLINAATLDGLDSTDFALVTALANYLLLTGGVLTGDLTLRSADLLLDNDTAEVTKIRMKSGDSNMWVTSDDIDVAKFHRTEARILQLLALDEDPTNGDQVGNRDYNDNRYLFYVDWAAPTLLNSWVNFGQSWENARFRKNGKVVEVQGMVMNGTATVGTTLFTLPAGFRPEARIMVATSRYDNVHCRLDIQTNGNVDLGTAVDNTWVNIDFSFPVD
jgi:hypothetical protein